MEIGDESYDVIVVGSGYGGSVVACRLSMAGAKVCLIEKGKQWSAQDFPTNSLSILAATKMEFSKWGFGFGSDKALFQVYEQGDTLCCVTCGLGGGSLVNAAVLTPTPVRARRNPRWPEEWNNDWESYQATASAMLGSNNIPFEFSSAKVMKQVVEEEIEDCKADAIKLGINFGQELKHQTKEGQEIGSCVACGNCLSGCPYNAKNSNDRTYIASAIQAGCVVKTKCEIRYIIKTATQGNGEENMCNGIKEHRRWRVHFDDLEHVSTDFVVLSAGVLGTTKILFDSERRGLSLSPMLGYGFSCNGNNVAYVAGSQAPLNAYGLNRRQFTTIPLQDRPGPAITSSYTSSLGFTIQAAVLPTSYPYMLFKGIATYGWPNSCWFLHGLIDKMKHLMRLKASQAMVLNVMGYDSCDGRITFNKETNTIRFTHAHDPLLPRKIQALQSITKRLGGILFMSRYRSTSVHLLGGCNVALDPANGVCNPKGQVFNVSGDQPAVHKGLYVCDGSLIPCSVGINPILTITTASEYISKHLIEEVQNFRNRFRQNEVIMTTRLVEEICDSTIHSKKSVKLQSHHGIQITKDKENVTFKETMKGFIAGMPCTTYLVVKMNLGCKTTNPHPHLKGKVGGYVLYQAISKEPLYIIDGEVDLLALNDRTPYTQYMYYRLILASHSGSRYLMEGKKVMNPYILATYAWKETRTLHVNFRALSEKDDNESKVCRDIDQQKVDLRGELHLSVVELLKSLISMRGNQKIRFVYLLLQSLWRTYILQMPREVEPRSTTFDKNTKTYPPSTLHELKTGDGHLISCQQWKSGNVNTWKSEGQSYPILLLNGYSGESFCLPTEPTDLVRTLVEEGYETWSLQSRGHPKHASNNFTIEDIAKFDIPAVITKIQELHGRNTKIHVIAHCVGGLSIHITLLGGYVSATYIASLSCVNSSMFYKLTKSALVKMKLPLIPLSMAILGRNKIISMFEEPSESFGHSFVKSIVKLIPRHERCTLTECNLFSGIFGNSFWHENVSQSIHEWLIKKNITRLPLSAFPHLRKICLSGFVVDPKGKNEYLIHPERMAVPTLYVSGGRTLLVTPETTFLAHKYMTLHQPRFKHKRVVIDGFGHSDLLIGEDAQKKVFPHFLSHIRLVEEGVMATEGKDSLLSWDGTHDGDERFRAWNYFLYLTMLLVLAIAVLYII